MSQILIGLDDTDAPGARNSTARLARMLGEHFSSRHDFIGSIGHRLCPEIAATTNNKASCVILRAEAAPAAVLAEARDFLAQAAAPAAPFGLVVARLDQIDNRLKQFGRRASASVATLDEARAVLAALPHFGAGSGRGLIGAAAALGLTAEGWSGRWLERAGGLRQVERALTVAELTAAGVIAVSLETDAEVPKPADYVDTHGWLRPQLLGGRAVLPLRRVAEDGWEVVAVKTPKNSFSGPAVPPPATHGEATPEKTSPKRGHGHGDGGGKGRG